MLLQQNSESLRIKRNSQCSRHVQRRVTRSGHTHRSLVKRRPRGACVRARRVTPKGIIRQDQIRNNDLGVGSQHERGKETLAKLRNVGTSQHSDTGEDSNRSRVGPENSYRKSCRGHLTPWLTRKDRRHWLSCAYHCCAQRSILTKRINSPNGVHSSRSSKLFFSPL